MVYGACSPENCSPGTDQQHVWAITRMEHERRCLSLLWHSTGTMSADEGQYGAVSMLPFHTVTFTNWLCYGHRKTG